MIVGIDIGRKVDPTCIIKMSDTWEVNEFHMLPLQLEYHEINNYIRDHVNDVDVMYIDQTGIGDAIVGDLRQTTHDSQVNGVILTGGEKMRGLDSTWYVSKTKLLDMLARAMRENLKIKLPQDEAICLKEQLTAMIHHKNGSIGARLGMHDDAVIALALCVFGKLVESGQ